MPHLSWNEVRDRAIRFSRDPVNVTAASERAHKQTFYNAFFDVFGLRRASVASFEENVRNLKGHTSAIDLLWKGRLLVEHKSRGEDLALAATQAFTYIEDLTREDRWDEVPRYVLVCDFARFVLYDLEPEDQLDLPLFAGRQIGTHHFTLAEFPKHVRHFAFMLGQTRVRYKPEDEANEKAYARMCQLHDELRAGGFTGHELERLLVRLLFCLFAEDNGIFDPETFTAFIRTRTRPDGSDLGQHLQHFFEILDTAPAQRQRGLDDDLAAFPYVNGRLFEERLRTPVFTAAMRQSLLFCCDFQWARISPAVFGSLFQGIMEKPARRQQGAHYTSERDILKVIRTLFLDELRAEWTRLLADRSSRRIPGLQRFHQRLRELQFLDPACGCGNFLVLAYRELRLLETEVLRELLTTGGGQALFPIVDVDQFHGIEIGEWPVRIAEVALWLMDHQMNSQASELFLSRFERLPLRATPHIVHANALRLDWHTVLPAAQCSYVLGNPPFIGKAFRGPDQQADMALIWDGVKGAGVLDFVTCWYVKAARYITGADAETPGSTGRRPVVPGGPPGTSNVSRTPPSGTHAPITSGASGGPPDATGRRPVLPIPPDAAPRVAFVSTNSISQGEQVGILWGHLFQRYGIKIHFAHRTFAWASEARGRAHVHVVIIGFGAFDVTGKRIFDYEAADPSKPEEPVEIPVGNISPYLLEGGDLVLSSRSRPCCPVPPMDFGSMPNDGGYLLFSASSRENLLREEPQARDFLRRFVGSEEFLHGIERWCLWLPDKGDNRWREMKPIIDCVRAVGIHRRASPRAATQKLALSSHLFGEIRQPTHRYLLVPGVSSENRKYIPIGFLPPTVVASNLVNVVPDADHWHFGVLSSAMHMAWVRVVAGRLESRYRYSTKIVYNNFPWPERVSPARRAAVEAAAHRVLEMRVEHGDGRVGFLPTGPKGSTTTLAQLYDTDLMPADLARAHAALDRAVEKCYRPAPFHSDRERVEHLFRLYEQLTAPLLPATPKTRHRRSQPAAQAAPARRRTPGLPGTG